MRILLLGSGGREHALAWKLAQEAEVMCAPGNPGIAEDCECRAISLEDQSAVEQLCQELQPDLVVVGPEAPLIAGLGDRLRRAGFSVFGPSEAGARLEGSKAFAKDLMREHGVTTAEFSTFEDPELAAMYARAHFEGGRQVVVKASGAALGKGAIVCSSLEEAEDAIRMMMVDGELGDAGRTVVIEERLSGPEFSLLTICSGAHFASLPVSQDYKRALNGDRGPNTGGMGSYSPVGWVNQELVRQTEDEVVKPMLDALQMHAIDFRGVLFSGLILHGSRPYCLEYNVRFGDPETQTVMMRLGSGLADALLAAAEGRSFESPEVLDNAAVTVVIASGGYPGAVKKGLPIELPVDVPQGVKLFHAGTATADARLVTSGGRVLGVTASAPTLEEARILAYETARQVRFEGARYREDIAILT
jgi:phosphoribosylamine---glycine ligase